MAMTPLRSRLSPLRSRGPSVGGTQAEIDKRRNQRPYRKWYKTARWQALRMMVLTRDLFTCQWPGCGRLEGDTSKLVADHRKPHRGEADLFWDAENLWTLCKPCHDKHKQREERSDL